MAAPYLEQVWGVRDYVFTASSAFVDPPTGLLIEVRRLLNRSRKPTRTRLAVRTTSPLFLARGGMTMNHIPFINQNIEVFIISTRMGTLGRNHVINPTEAGTETLLFLPQDFVSSELFR